MNEAVKKLGDEPVNHVAGNCQTSLGITKREYFAALAMQGMMDTYSQNLNLMSSSVAKKICINGGCIVRRIM